MVFYFWNLQWTNSSWFQRPLVSVDRNQVSLPSWKDKTTFVSRNNYVVIIERLVNGLIVFWVSECSSPLWARKINFQSKTLSTVLNPNPIRKHFIYPDYFSFCTRPREIEGNENNNLGWQKFNKKNVCFSGWRKDPNEKKPWKECWDFDQVSIPTYTKVCAITLFTVSDS